MICWYLKSVSHHFSGWSLIWGKIQRRGVWAKEESFKRLKGNGQKVEWCDLSSFPQSFGSTASDTFLCTAFEMQLKFNYRHVPSTGRGALSDVTGYEALFIDPAFPELSLLKAAGAKPVERFSIQLFFFFLLLLHFSFSTDLAVYICSHNRELWPRLMAPSNLASLTGKWHFHTAQWGNVF